MSKDQKSVAEGSAKHEPAEAQSAGASNDLLRRAKAGDPHAVSQLRRIRKKQKQKQATPPKATHVDFAEGDGSTCAADDLVDDEPKEVLENPILVDEILDGAGGPKKGESNDGDEALKGVGETVAQGDETKEMVGTIEGETEEADASPWIKAAMAPAILSLIRQHKFGDAAALLAKQFSPSQYFEGILHATEKVGIEIGKPLLKWLVEYGTEANVLWDLTLWTYGGLMSIAEAHEKGDRESAIRMYAFAFADGFLKGEEGADGNRAGAVTQEQKEAVERGIEDGAKTIGGFGVNARGVAAELERRFNGNDTALERSIMDGLMKRAGLPGVWS